MRQPKRTVPAVALPVPLSVLPNRELVAQLMAHAEALGRTKKALCCRLGVMSDKGVEWLAKDYVARGSTLGGMVFGTEEYTERRIQAQKALEEKLRRRHPQDE